MGSSRRCCGRRSASRCSPGWSRSVRNPEGYGLMIAGRGSRARSRRGDGGRGGRDVVRRAGPAHRGDRVPRRRPVDVDGARPRPPTPTATPRRARRSPRPSPLASATSSTPRRPGPAAVVDGRARLRRPRRSAVPAVRAGVRRRTVHLGGAVDGDRRGRRRPRRPDRCLGDGDRAQSAAGASRSSRPLGCSRCTGRPTGPGS